MLTLIQRIIGIAITAVGLKLWQNGMSIRICLAIIVFGILVTINTPKKKKEEEDEDEW
ncbi:MAG: hypothetical protein GXP25_18075 [Planctomycetes bacterium]|nr:hypothetical protein [Planctomycetota bacterium]